MEITSTRNTVSLTDEDYENLIDMAGYGIVYWADKAVVTDADPARNLPGIYDVHHVDQPVMVPGPNGEALPRTHTALTKADLEKAIARLLDGDVTVDPRLVQYIRDDDIDAEAADVIVQVAIFGEIIFG